MQTTPQADAPIHEPRTPAPSLAPLYELLHVLGRGGMATVYLARESKHGRQVAVKVLDRDTLDDVESERFLLEIHLTARLSHPHIVPLLDSGKAEGRPYYVMPFVDGGTLRVRTEAGPLDAAEAIKLAGEVADALAYAHAQGVLHRDVKPENIILSGRSAVVTDFGLARALQAVDEVDGRPADMVAGLGTPAYMSPEQAAGGSEIDERSDVYSLGAVLYEMLTGEPPFTGATPLAVIAKRFTEPPPSPRSKRAEVDEALDALVRRALAFEPTERYASAAELGDAIERVGRAVSERSTQVTTEEIAAAVPSVAVLPFENPSDDAEVDFLASGIAEDIVTSLVRAGRVRVAGRGSAVVMADAKADVRAISERLGVRTVLMGSVRRSGDRVRVSASLVNGADGFQMWAERFDRTMDDLFAVQDEIAEYISGALHGTLGAVTGESPVLSGPGARARRVTTPEAYNAYLRGRHMLGRRTAQDMRASIAWFHQAIRLDDGFAAAHAAVADARGLLGVYGEDEPAATFEAARKAASRALLLEPALPAAHSALGVIQAGYDWNFAAAEQSFAASLAGRADATAHQWLATMVLLPQSRFEEAFVAVRRALRLDPLSLSARSTLTVSLLYARRFDEAVHAARETLDLESRFALAHFFHAQALLAQGDVTGAVRAAEKARELSGNSGETLALAAFAYGASGDRTAARSLAIELRARVGTRYVADSHLALAELGAGDADAALTLLERAVEDRVTDLIWLDVRPVWDALRGVPRFQALSARRAALAR